MVTGFVKIDGNWYYLNASGVIQTGWQQFGNNWRYFDEAGIMLADTTREIDGTSYEFNSSGICLNK
jgi:glucan-binding YG repeat protein